MSLNEINTRIDHLEKKIETLILLIENDIKPDCKKMSSHIDFIEVIYNKLKYPIDVICSKLDKPKLLSYK
tara:strand:+ start:146 stop:355 length:210 start_codon:yes stop_codon:yes gene_type:complete